MPVFFSVAPWSGDLCQPIDCNKYRSLPEICEAKNLHAAKERAMKRGFMEMMEGRASTSPNTDGVCLEYDAVRLTPKQHCLSNA